MHVFMLEILLKCLRTKFFVQRTGCMQLFMLRYVSY